MGLGFVNANDFGHGINLLVRLSLVKPSLESVDKLPSASAVVGAKVRGSGLAFQRCLLIQDLNGLVRHQPVDMFYE